MPAGRLVDEPADRRLVQHVDNAALDGTARDLSCRGEVGDGLLDLSVVDAAEVHRGTASGQKGRGRPADSAASASDAGDLAVSSPMTESAFARPVSVRHGPCRRPWRGRSRRRSSATPPW